MTRTLVLGGARSGKSMYAQTAAEAFAKTNGGQLVMIATAEAHDDEMRERIAQHRKDRGPVWRTIEVPLGLSAALMSLQETDVAVVDCLTLWLNNLMMTDAPIPSTVQSLAAAFLDCRARLWVVSNEVGFGIVPENPLARLFRDVSGRLHLMLGHIADDVVLVVAGQPLKIK